LDLKLGLGVVTTVGASSFGVAMGVFHVISPVFMIDP
jgi:hypothetical protein